MDKLLAPDPSIRYLVFRKEDFYPCGAMEDCIGKFATEDEARAATVVFDSGLGAWSYYSIYDTWTGEDCNVILGANE